MQEKQTKTAKDREKLNERIIDALMNLYATSPERFAAAMEYANSIMKGGEDA